MDIRDFQEIDFKTFKGVNDKLSPIVKPPHLAEKLDNWELTNDESLSMRRGSLLLDRGGFYRMFNAAAFTADLQYDGGPQIGSFRVQYCVRYFNSVTGEYSLPWPVTEVNLDPQPPLYTQIDGVFIQMNFTNANFDISGYNQAILYRTLDIGQGTSEYYDGIKFYRIATFTTEVVGETVGRYLDVLDDAAVTAGAAGDYIILRRTQDFSFGTHLTVVQGNDLGAPALNAGVYNYTARYYSSAYDLYADPWTVRSVTLEDTTAVNENTVVVAIEFETNPDERLYDQTHLFRQLVDADPDTDPWYRVDEFDSSGRKDYLDVMTDAILLISSTPFLMAGVISGLDCFAPVTSIIDFRRRMGGPDVLFTAGPYIKSMEHADAIYSDLQPDVLNSWVVFQNAVFLVNGTNFLTINQGGAVFEMGGSGPLQAPQVSNIGGPNNGPYAYAYTWYDDGLVTEHPWESEAGPYTVYHTFTDEGGHITRDGAADPPPSRATHWRIYRTTAGGAINNAFFVEDVPIADTEYFDIKTDAELGQEIVPFDANQPPSDLNLKFIIEANERLYGAGNHDSPSSVYHTPKGKPEQWSVLNSRFTLEEDDGDPVIGLCELDGIVFVLKRDYVYRLIGDPSEDADRLGFKNGGTHFRALSVTRNGFVFEGSDSYYYCDGNTIFDIGDYIATFLANEADSSTSELRASQIIDFQTPLKKQLICLLRTTDSGEQNSVAAVYHYLIGDVPEGWTFFRNFRATTLGVIEDARDRDQLLIGNSEGEVFVHDRVDGYDESKFINFGAGGQPFLEQPIPALPHYNNLCNANTDFSVTSGSMTATISPAGSLRLTTTGAIGTTGILRILSEAAINFKQCTRIKLTDVELIALVDHDSSHDIAGSSSALFSLHFYGLGADDTAVNVAANYVSHIIGISNEGIWVNTKYQSPGGVFDSPEAMELVYKWGVGLGIPVPVFDLEVDLVSIPGEGVAVPAASDSPPAPIGVGYGTVKFITIKVDDVVVFNGPVTGRTHPVEPPAQSPLEFALSNEYDTIAPVVHSDVRFSQIDIWDLGPQRTLGIEEFIEGDAIEAVYESGWMDLDIMGSQKFMKWMYLVATSNGNFDINVIIYTDLIEDGGQTEAIPVLGGTLWDVAKWDKSVWDGLKKTIGSRAALNRTGNRFKIRIEVDEPGAHVQLFGFNVSVGVLDSTDRLARADEGVPVQ